MVDAQSQAQDGAKATEAPAAKGKAATPPKRRLPFVLLFVLALASLWWTHGRVDAPERWRTDALLLGEDRLPDDRLYLILSHEGSAGEEESLRAASLTLQRERPELRVPIAAPPGEIGAWLDAHALYLLPVDSHAELAARFEDEAMTRAVQELRAHLSSPFFGFMGEEARRDPLGVRPLLTPYLGASERPFASRARVTSTGDLLRADGHALMVELRSSESRETLESSLRTLLADVLADENAPITLEVIDPREPEAPPRPFAPYAPLAAAALVAFAVERQLRGPLLRIAIALLGCALAWFFAPSGAPFETPLYCTLFGVGYWLAGPRATHSYAPTIVGLALAPLIASVYPGWVPWTSAWVLACTACAALGWLASLRDEAPAPGTAPKALVPEVVATVFAALVVLAAAGGGTYLMSTLEFSGTHTTGDQTRRERLAKEFFDPAMVAHSRSWDGSQVRALARSAEDHQALRLAADELQLRLDGPGTYLLSQKRLEARREGLRELRLRARMAVLRDLLETEGFRPEAFSEFLDASARLDELPDAQAALDGNLGPWIESRTYAGSRPADGEASEDDPSDAVEIETRLYFTDIVRPPPIADSRGEALELHGPVIAAANDHELARSHLVVAVAISAWLASLLSFIARRHFATSLLVGAIGIVAGSAGLAALHFEGVAPGAELFVPLLVVIAVGQAETEASIESVAAGRPASLAALFGRIGPLLGVALLCMASVDPITHQWGLIVAVGGTLGAFAAHVLSPRLAAALAVETPTANEDAS